MQKFEALIRTKLRQPFMRPALVPRPRLQEQVRQGLGASLTLITAPAGFGKTTLAVSCVAGCGMPTAWLSLDRDDNQPGRFLSYLTAALQTADPRIGQEAEQLAKAQQAPPEAVLTSLVNDLDRTGDEIVLVLDDYQFLNSQAVHDQVAFLLEHCPHTFHLVIASRSDPPLPLARLRGRGQMVELRTADLRFSEPEAGQFLNEVMGLSLDAGSIAALEEHTEGWIAGLQMAALSMRDREDISGFIEGFSGTNRYILDYLLEEVLASQPPENQCFLLCTSILERLTAPLCAAVLEAQPPESQEAARMAAASPAFDLLSCKQMLERLDRANLFLLPLDQERRWYRYHHLFADLLRARLNQIYPGLEPQLHSRASAWHEQNGSIWEAIQHASLALDEETVERIIEGNYLELMNRGEMSRVRYWMGKLSKELVARRPWLCLYEAFSRSWFGQLEEADVWLAEAEKRIRAVAADEVPGREMQTMLGYHDFVRSRVTAMQGDTRTAIAFCLAAREKIPADNLGLRIEVGITLGYEYFLIGDFENASQTLQEMIQACHAVGAINNPVAAYALLARLHILKGQLHEAEDLFQKAARLIRETGDPYPGMVGLVEVGAAALSYEWNDLKAALVGVQRGLESLPSWGKADDLCLATITLSRIQLAQGNLAQAEAAVGKAARIMQTCGVFSEARSAVEAAQVRLWLAQGDWAAAGGWAGAFAERLDPQEPFRFENELAQITQARVRLAQNKPQEALRWLSGLEESARSGGRQGRLVEIMLLTALARQAQGEAARAEAALAESLRLAQPAGYLRIFLDEGRPMQRLFAQWLVHVHAGPLRDYAVQILAQLEAELAADAHASPGGGPLAAPEARPVQSRLVEPLSQRELEVLRLMALGKTNREIAQELIVAPGTIKAHTASIYRKLEVANRTEAAARALQLGILH